MSPRLFRASAKLDTLNDLFADRTVSLIISACPCPLWVKSRHVQRTSRCLLCANSGHSQPSNTNRKTAARRSLRNSKKCFDQVQNHQFASLVFASAERPHREPHCISVKPNAWRLSGIREYCHCPRQHLRNAALRLYHTCVQHCSPAQRIFWKVFLGPFEDIRACYLRALAHRLFFKFLAAS